MFIRHTHRVEYVNTEPEPEQSEDGPSVIYSRLWYAGLIALALLAAVLIVGAPWIAAFLLS